MKKLGELENFIRVEDECPFCSNRKFRYVLQSHPPYEGFYDTKCGFCGKTPRIEAEKEAYYEADTYI